MTGSRRREATLAAQAPEATGTDLPPRAGADDTLTLLFLCCHPAILRPSQLALTLRAVGGLTTAEVARALLVPEATMAQRISRAKRQIRQAGATFELPAPTEYPPRLGVVLHASAPSATRDEPGAAEAQLPTRCSRNAAPP